MGTDLQWFVKLLLDNLLFYKKLERKINVLVKSWEDKLVFILLHNVSNYLRRGLFAVLSHSTKMDCMVWKGIGLGG